MDDKTTSFLRVNHIDSYQKLRFLLLLQRHSDLQTTGQELTKQLKLGAPLLKEIIADLEKAGLVDCVDGHCTLHNEPDTSACLQCLVKVFDDPLARQTLLDQVRNNTSLSPLRPSYLY